MTQGHVRRSRRRPARRRPSRPVGPTRFPLRPVSAYGAPVTEWLTLCEAEAVTGRDEAEIYSAMRRGHLRCVRLDEWLIDAADVIAWAAQVPAAELWP